LTEHRDVVDKVANGSSGHVIDSVIEHGANFTRDENLLAALICPFSAEQKPGNG
jgi:hypothetical protein